jgi:hypothetical protein
MKPLTAKDTLAPLEEVLVYGGSSRYRQTVTYEEMAEAWKARSQELLDLCPLPNRLYPYAAWRVELEEVFPPMYWFDELQKLLTDNDGENSYIAGCRACDIENCFEVLAPTPELSKIPCGNSPEAIRELRAIAAWHAYQGRDTLAAFFECLVTERIEGKETTTA